MVAWAAISLRLATELPLFLAEGCGLTSNENGLFSGSEGGTISVDETTGWIDLTAGMEDVQLELAVEEEGHRTSRTAVTRGDNNTTNGFGFEFGIIAEDTFGKVQGDLLGSSGRTPEGARGMVAGSSQCYLGSCGIRWDVGGGTSRLVILLDMTIETAVKPLMELR